MLTILPVNFCGKGKLVTVKALVSDGNKPLVLEMTYKYLATRVCMKSPLLKFKVAVTAPVVELKSPGAFKLVTPPMMTLLVPSVRVNAWTRMSFVSTIPLVFRSMNFCTVTEAPVGILLIIRVIVPL